MLPREKGCRNLVPTCQCAFDVAKVRPRVLLGFPAYLLARQVNIHSDQPVSIRPCQRSYLSLQQWCLNLVQRRAQFRNVLGGQLGKGGAHGRGVSETRLPPGIGHRLVTGDGFGVTSSPSWTRNSRESLPAPR